MFGLYESAFGSLIWGSVFMLFIGCGLIYLGVARKIEPVLLVPIGAGIIMVNIPAAGLMVYAPPVELGAVPLPAVGGINELVAGEIGVPNLLYEYGIRSTIIPLLIFLSLGAMTDFSPAIARPLYLWFGVRQSWGFLSCSFWHTLQDGSI